MQLIPTRILNCADLIRSIRNEFVHDLSTNELDKLAPSTLQSMRDQVKQFNPYDAKGETRELFEKLVSFTAVALCAYKIQVSRLNDFIRSPKFMNYLKEHVEEAA